jgi:hypothetical protein
LPPQPFIDEKYLLACLPLAASLAVGAVVAAARGSRAHFAHATASLAGSRHRRHYRKKKPQQNSRLGTSTPESVQCQPKNQHFLGGGNM